MTPEQFKGILNYSNLSSEQQQQLGLFYDKAMVDGDTVARLEEEIKTNKERMEKFSTPGDIIVRKAIGELLNKILNS